MGSDGRVALGYTDDDVWRGWLGIHHNITGATIGGPIAFYSRICGGRGGTGSCSSPCTRSACCQYKGKHDGEQGCQPEYLPAVAVNCMHYDLSLYLFRMLYG